MNDLVTLVDLNDREVGAAEKLRAHRSQMLHRAFSVCLFNDRNELLLQKRAQGKYHSAGLWTNSCCGHPRPGEGLLDAAHRRLREELNIDAIVTPVTSFVYLATLANGLIEYELDHLLVGRFNGEIVANPLEVEEVRWASAQQIEIELANHPSRFTVWFPIAWRMLNAGASAAAG